MVWQTVCFDVCQNVAEGGSDVAVDASGKLVFSDEARLFGMHPNGSVERSRTLGGKLVLFGAGQHVIRPQLVAANGHLLLAGSFVGRLDLGGAVLESQACSDAFVARFAP